MNTVTARRLSGRDIDRPVMLAVVSVLFVTAAFLVSLTAMTAEAGAAVTGVDLATYKRVGRFDLPEPTRTPAPPGNLLAQEAGGVAYNPDTDTLFVVGDGGTAVTQVDKTGQLIDTMTLPPGPSPKDTTFFDPEGITYIGGGRFVMTEERDRNLVRFTYVAGGTLTRAAADTVTLGTPVSNTGGLEGVTNDPLSGGFIVVKEMKPSSIFQTGVDWEAGTATNGSPTTVASTDLFDPSLAALTDFVDVFSLANVATAGSPEAGNLLILSRDSGQLINVDRTGRLSSWMAIVGDEDNPLSVPAQAHEGVTMDGDGNLYLVSEEGGGDVAHPQLWVYAPASEPNQAPTAIRLTNQVNSLPETTPTTARIKVADIRVDDDGIGNNLFTVSGPDAGHFVANQLGLHLRAGTVLNSAAKDTYSVRVEVDDIRVGGSPDATSATFILKITSSSTEPPPAGPVTPPTSAPPPPGSGGKDVLAPRREPRRLRLRVGPVRRVNKGAHSRVHFRLRASRAARIRLILRRGGPRGSRLAVKRINVGRRPVRVTMRLSELLPRRAKASLVVIARDRGSDQRIRKVIRL